MYESYLPSNITIIIHYSYNPISYSQFPIPRSRFPITEFKILDHLHKQQYFHRDIKPSNIMLKPDGQLVLVDFGAIREVVENVTRNAGL